MTGLLAVAKETLPDCVAVAYRDPAQQWPMTDAEALSISKAVPKRKREFSAGRDAARECLTTLGASSLEITVKNRAPVWPDGCTGSITHTDDACLAAVASTDAIFALGIDLEHAMPLPVDVMPIVLREDETCDGRIAFSVKEAVYKMLSAHIPRMLEFHDLQVTRITNTLHQVRLTCDAGLWKNGDTFDVEVVRTGRHILSLCWLDKDKMP